MLYVWVFFQSLSHSSHFWEMDHWPIKERGWNSNLCPNFAAMADGTCTARGDELALSVFLESEWAERQNVRRSMASQSYPRPHDPACQLSCRGKDEGGVCCGEKLALLSGKGQSLCTTAPCDSWLLWKVPWLVREQRVPDLPKACWTANTRKKRKRYCLNVKNINKWILSFKIGPLEA